MSRRPRRSAFLRHCASAADGFGPAVAGPLGRVADKGADLGLVQGAREIVLVEHFEVLGRHRRTEKKTLVVVASGIAQGL